MSKRSRQVPEKSKTAVYTLSEIRGSMEIPRELVEKLSNGDCVVFVGAGVSAAAGMPGWSELIGALAVELSPPRQASLLEIAQVYEKLYGRQNLEDRIRVHLDSAGQGPSDNHALLCTLSNLGVTFVTTNYDDLLEQTLREQGRKRTVVVRDQDVPYMRPDYVTLVKLHGDKDRPGTIVVTLSDYLTIYDKVPLIRSMMTYLLASKTFLFVGYSLRDMDLQHFQAKVSSLLSFHARRSYALLYGVSDFDRSCLSSLEVIPVDLTTWGKGNKSEKLTSFLLELHMRIVLHRNRDKDIPKRVCTSSEARKLVPTDLVNKMKKDGRNLAGCIDFITYVDVTDSGQYNWQDSPDFRPHMGDNEHNRNVKYYKREDKDRNIHEGLAFFR